MSKRKTIALWTISGLLAAVFLFSGGIKLVQPVKNQATFGQFGYAGWFETFIGVCEMLGGIGLLVPRLAGLAAACLSILMAGAVYTQAVHNGLGQALLPVALIVPLVWVSYVRFKGNRQQ